MAPIDTSLRTVTTDTQKTGMVTDQLLLLSKEKSMEDKKRSMSNMHAFCNNVCTPFYTLFSCSYNFYNKEGILLLAFTKGIPARAVWN